MYYEYIRKYRVICKFIVSIRSWVFSKSLSRIYIHGRTTQLRVFEEISPSFSKSYCATDTKPLVIHWKKKYFHSLSIQTTLLHRKYGILRVTDNQRKHVRGNIDDYSINLYESRFSIRKHVQCKQITKT